jgi:HTH-type transcriptional regulator/antitoxin HigA
VEAVKISKHYIELVKKFPLLPIRSDAQHKAAIRVSLELGKKDGRMTAVERDYYRVLAMLIRDYESRRIRDVALASPQELLRLLAEEHNLKQVDIGKIIGHDSHVSAFLAGERNLNKAEAIKLGTYFGVDPAAFLPAPGITS